VHAGHSLVFEPCCISETCLDPSFEVTKTLLLTIWMLQRAAFTVAQMTAGRFVVGLGVGSAAMIVPLYIGELAPAKYRGRMIALENCTVAGGQFIAYCIGAGFAQVGQGWRYMVAIGTVPAIALACFLPMCPESTRQLVAHGKFEQAETVLARIYPASTPEQRRNKVKSIEIDLNAATQAMADKSLWWTYKQLHVVPSNFRAMVTACAVMGISQLGGFNTLMYYSGTLFAAVGFNKPVAVSITVGAANFIFGFFNVWLVDKLGRRRILQVTVLGMALSLTLAAVAFKFIPINTQTLTLESSQVNWAGILVLVTIIFYVAFFSSGVAPISWIGTERLPLEVRAMGTMVNTVTCWATNLIIASTFLTMMKSMTPSGAFGFYAGICFTGFVFISFCYAETKGMALEEVREVFNHGFGVSYARRWQKEHETEVKRRRSTYVDA
jgi:SP family myo-inositol transporter-like MFS transporter 13